MSDLLLIIFVGAIWYFIWGPGKPKSKEKKEEKGEKGVGKGEEKK